MMTATELTDLARCYVLIEGYTDIKSIYGVMCQEYPGAFDRKQALLVICKVLKGEKNERYGKK